jgi:hypothetical protein
LFVVEVFVGFDPGGEGGGEDDLVVVGDGDGDGAAVGGEAGGDELFGILAEFAVGFAVEEVVGVLVDDGELWSFSWAEEEIIYAR